MTTPTSIRTETRTESRAPRINLSKERVHFAGPAHSSRRPAPRLTLSGGLIVRR